METDSDSGNAATSCILSGREVNLNIEDETCHSNSIGKRFEEECVTEDAQLNASLDQQVHDQKVSSKEGHSQVDGDGPLDSVAASEKITGDSLKFRCSKSNASKETEVQTLVRSGPLMNKERHGRLEHRKMVRKSDTEEGELDDSGDETQQQLHQGSKKSFPLHTGPKSELGENLTLGEVQVDHKDDDTALNQLKDDVHKLAFEIDDVRPEEEIEQLDYDEDVLENKECNLNPKDGNELGEIPSEGEIVSDDGEIRDDHNSNDFEEGETRDHPEDIPRETKVCKFFELGTCTWGENCRFIHPGVNDKGNYNMFKQNTKWEESLAHPEMRESHHPPLWSKIVPKPNHMTPPPVVAETAWERGLRHAKELKKRAIQRKVQEPDFVQKREIISLNVALNEDRDMEFVGHRSLADANKGYDPFQEIEEDEYAVPPADELRRGRLMRDDRARKPSHFRNSPAVGLEGRPPPIMPLHPDENSRGRRSPNMRHNPSLRTFNSSRMSYESENNSFSVHNLSRDVSLYVQQRSSDKERREHFDDRFHQRVRKQPDEVTPSSDSDKRNLLGDKDKSYRESPSQTTSKNYKGSVARSDQWSDPWARARPNTRGKNKGNAGSRSSSSSSSHSGSSFRSSSRSSYSSHSSYSGSSRSSSRSSATSRSSSCSSNSDSSRSPSPTKRDEVKRKPLTSKQQNAKISSIKTPKEEKKPNVSTKQANPTVENQDSLTVKVSLIPKPEPQVEVTTNSKSGLTAKNIKLKVRGRQHEKSAAKTSRENKRTSSSSSEFSHSDSSASRSPSKGKKKSDSDSDSESNSSDSSDASSGSSSSDSEDQKPTSRKGKTEGASKLRKMPEATVCTVGVQNNGKVKVPSRPGRKDIQMTIREKHAPSVTQTTSRKRLSADISGQSKKGSNRRVELLEQLKAVEDAIARKRAKLV